MTFMLKKGNACRYPGLFNVIVNKHFLVGCFIYYLLIKCMYICVCVCAHMCGSSLRLEVVRSKTRVTNDLSHLIWVGTHVCPLEELVVPKMLRPVFSLNVLYFKNHCKLILL